MSRRRQIVILGVGGQGILFVTKLLAEAAMLDGREVITSETHGMAQRGGSVESHVKVGGFEGSLVRRGRADAAIALDRSRMPDALAYAGDPEGRFVDAPATADGFRAVDASGIARTLGFARGANLALLGFAAASSPDRFPTRESLLAAVDRLSPPKAKEGNRRAFLAGADRA